MMLAVAVASVIAIAFGVWKLMRRGEHRRRQAAISEGKAQVAKLSTVIAVEEDRAARQPELDAEGDRADAQEAAAVAQAELSGASDPERRSDGVVGGQMPTSDFDEELDL